MCVHKQYAISIWGFINITILKIYPVTFLFNSVFINYPFDLYDLVHSY